MAFDWKKLAPHKPLDPGDAAYVKPPSGGGEEIAKWVLAGGSTVLVGGPAGIGKSTELARAAELLKDERLVCLARIDRHENMRTLEPDRLALRLAGMLVEEAHQGRGLAVSRPLREHLHVKGVLNDPDALSATGATFPGGEGTLKLAIAEVARLARKRLVLLIDGLEKVPQDGTEAVFDVLRALSESVDLIVVIPWHLSFGPRPGEILRWGEKLYWLRAWDVEGEEGKDGREALAQILARKLEIDAAVLESHRELVMEAAQWSGGEPRTFLQLVADAGTYACLRGRDGWFSREDLKDAILDQQDSYRRRLLPGDREAIRAVRGKDGVEMDLPRKIRLMAHGILLERLRNGKPVLEVHPLAREVIEEG